MKTLFTFLMLFSCLFIFAQQPILDPSFGVNGRVITNFVDSTDDLTRSITIQPDGKFIILGYYVQNNQYEKIAIVRYNPDGSRDSSFGDAGRVSNSFADLLDVDMKSIAVQPDGKIVGCGQSSGGFNASALFRLNADGSFDSTFSNDGIETYYFGGLSMGEDLFIQPDGKILLTSFLGGGAIRMMVMRANIDGTLDSAFGINGLAKLNLNYTPGKRIGMQSTGKIIVGGDSINPTPFNFIAARFDSIGTLDSTFGSQGLFHTDVYGKDECTALAIQQDDKIILGGFGTNINNEAMEVVRLTSDGILDSTFGNAGKVIIQVIPGAGAERLTEIKLLPDGRILLGGYCLVGAARYFVMIRLNTTGSIDTTFSGSGIDSIRYDRLNTGSNFDINTDGSILIAGDEILPTQFGPGNWSHNFCIIKTNSIGQPDSSFCNWGLLSDGINYANENLVGLLLQANGSFIAGGVSSRRQGDYHMAFARYDQTGTLDPGFGNLAGLDTILNDGVGINLFAIELDQNEKIVCGGYGGMVRLNNNGSIDTAFGINSFSSVDIPGYTEETVQSIDFQLNGKIILGCLMRDTSNNYQRMVMRYYTNGTLDSTFGNSGSYIFPDSMYPTIVKVDANDRILVGSKNYVSQFFRLDQNGIPDTTFQLDTSVLLNGLLATGLFSISLDGKILSYGKKTNKVFSFRLLDTGALDASYGSSGIDSSTAIYPLDNFVLFTDNSTIVIGTNEITNPDELILIRKRENGSLDSTWGVNGIAYVYVSPRFSPNHNLAGRTPVITKLLADQSILIGCNFTSKWPVETNDFLILKVITSLHVGLTSENNSNSKQVLVYPNPVSQNDINISYSLDHRSDVSISLHDKNGKIISRNQLRNLQQGDHAELIHIPPGVASGTYFLQLESDCNTAVVQLQYVRD